MKPYLLILLVVFTCDWSALAWGDVILPPAAGNTFCEGDSPFPIQNPSAYTVPGRATGSVQEAPFVQLMSHAAVPTGVSSQALTNLEYFFEVVGGSAGDHVPLLIQTGLGGR